MSGGEETSTSLGNSVPDVRRPARFRFGSGREVCGGVDALRGVVERSFQPRARWPGARAGSGRAPRSGPGPRSVREVGRSAGRGYAEEDFRGRRRADNDTAKHHLLPAMRALESVDFEDSREKVGPARRSGRDSWLSCEPSGVPVQCLGGGDRRRLRDDLGAPCGVAGEDTVVIGLIHPRWGNDRTKALRQFLRSIHKGRGAIGKNPLHPESNRTIGPGFEARLREGRTV